MKVALYARVSTEKQEEEGTIDSQIVALEEYCQKNGHVIVGKYIDNGYSGTLLARPELDKLRDDASKEIFDAILIHSPDRLARKYVYQELVIEELKAKEIQIIFLNRPIAETPEDQLLLGVQGIIAEYERAKFMERTRRGRLHKAKSGHILGNIPPYGYKCITKGESKEGYAYYVIDKEEAEIVRVMFDLLVKGQMTTYGLMSELINKGIKARNGKNWGRSSVHRVLINETYTGITHYNKHYGVPSQTISVNGEIKYHRRKNTTFKLRPKEEWIHIKVPRLISDELFKTAQRQLESNQKFAVRNTKQKYLLRGLVKCGVDGRSFFGVPMHGRPFYRCAGKNKLVSEVLCSSSSISAIIVEPIVWSSIKDLMGNPDLVLDQLKRKQEERKNGKSNFEGQISEISSQLIKLKIEEGRLLKAYSEGVINLDQLKEQNQRIKEENLKLEQNKEEIRKEGSHENVEEFEAITIKNYLMRYRDTMDSMQFDKKQQFLRLVLDQVLIQNKEIVMSGVLPAGQNALLRPQHLSCWNSWGRENNAC